MIPSEVKSNKSINLMNSPPFVTPVHNLHADNAHGPDDSFYVDLPWNLNSWPYFCGGCMSLVPVMARFCT